MGYSHPSLLMDGATLNRLGLTAEGNPKVLRGRARRGGGGAASGDSSQSAEPQPRPRRKRKRRSKKGSRPAKRRNKTTVDTFFEKRAFLALPPGVAGADEDPYFEGNPPPPPSRAEQAREEETRWHNRLLARQLQRVGDAASAAAHGLAHAESLPGDADEAFPGVSRAPRDDASVASTGAEHDIMAPIESTVALARGQTHKPCTICSLEEIALARKTVAKALQIATNRFTRAMLLRCHTANINSLHRDIVKNLADERITREAVRAHYFGDETVLACCNTAEFADYRALCEAREMVELFRQTLDVVEPNKRRGVAAMQNQWAQRADTLQEACLRHAGRSNSSTRIVYMDPLSCFPQISTTEAIDTHGRTVC